MLRESETQYSVNKVLLHLGNLGIATQRETVAFVSDQVLGLQTRARPTSHRKWTRAQIDTLTQAFQLQRLTGMDWDEVARVVLSGEIEPQLLEQVENRTEHLARELRAYETLCSSLRNMATTHHDTRLAASA